MTLSANASNQALNNLVLGTANLNGKTAFDSNSLNNLKIAAKDNSPEAIKAVAKQFEAVFMNMMLKSMREATSQDSPFDNEQSRTFTSMLDQQLSQNMSEKGLGLADLLARQLTKTASINPENMQIPLDADGLSFDKLMPGQELNWNLPALNSKKIEQQSLNPSSFEAFAQKLEHHAEAASLRTGIPAHLMLGQAALETGWGKREIKSADGSNSFNLFGIKATGNWQGKVAQTSTTEYINGIKQTRVEKFRAYDSYAESFQDFAKLMQNNPRYQHVMANTGDINRYANAMQQAGYASDPNYANKLASVIKKVVNS